MSKRFTDFSTESILTKKPRQGFLINQILGIAHMLGSVQTGDGASTSSTTRKTVAKDYVKKLECSLEHVAKFHYVKVRSAFSIQEVPANPEGMLAGIFQYCIDEAKEDNRERGMHPTHLGCMISSPLLTGGDIPVPVRQITDNTIDTILNLFNKVAQSKQQNSVTLWGEPFTVTITTVDRTGLPSKRRVRGGARRKLAPVHHQIHEQCLIKIRNPDEHNYCLFYALQATMVDKTKQWPRWKFFDYLHNRKGQHGVLQQETLHLMRQIGAPFGLDAYDADTYVPRVIDHWNNSQQQHRFAVFIFGSTGQYKPLYKYVDNTYDTPLLLYFNNNHFDGVQKQGGLFGRKYCLECEVPYHKDSQHNNSCKARCMLCGRAGPDFPCTPHTPFFKECATCNKKFRNNNCYNHHVHSGFCKRSKLCKKCGTIWDVPNNTQNGRQGHKCGEKFCALCNNYHNPERGCFIQQLEPKENDPYRIVAFDLETMQHLPVDAQHPKHRNHEPNFVSAKVACPDCISNGKWRQSLTDGVSCTVCGKHRTIAFCQRRFADTPIDKQVVTDTPLEAFVDWLVNDLPTKYDTYAYSHFGGRFDMVITFRELFKIGFNPEMLKRNPFMHFLSMPSLLRSAQLLPSNSMFDPPQQQMVETAQNVSGGGAPTPGAHLQRTVRFDNRSTPMSIGYPSLLKQQLRDLVLRRKSLVREEPEDDTMMDFSNNRTAQPGNESLLVSNQLKSGIAYDPSMAKHQCLCAENSNHVEHSGRVQSIWARLVEKGLAAVCERVTVRKAPLELLRLVHSPTYVTFFAVSPTACLKMDPAELPLKSFVQLPCGGIGVDSDTYFNDASTQTAAKMAVGSLVELCCQVVEGKLRNGFACIRPLAITPKDRPWALLSHQRFAATCARIAIIDWDVHHGNGTQLCFETDPNCLYLSMHRHDNGNFFPGNILLLAARCPVRKSPSAFYNLSSKIFGYFTRTLTQFANGRVVLALEGGYELTAICDSAEECVKALCSNGGEITQLSAETLEQIPNNSAQETIQKVIAVHKKHWPCLTGVQGINTSELHWQTISQRFSSLTVHS
uniref:histone deacetylase n=1 Tax=Globodera pallida TaxID=36090 RepID=A0A183BVL6_GLOPA